jgi:hypothetical protein
MPRRWRHVAKSAWVWGTRGRRFESDRPERENPLETAGFLLAAVVRRGAKSGSG